jgi:peptide/nickel transport system substrate-binding protein
MDKPGLGFAGLWLNLTRPPLNRPELRQALSWAVDRAEIVEAALPGGAIANDTVIPAPLIGHDPSFHPYLQPDLQRAGALLRGAGLANVPLAVTYSGGSPQLQQVTEVVRAQAGRSGITITLDPVDPPTVQRRVVGGDFEAFLGTWQGAVDPDGQTYPIFHSQGSSNYARYSSPRLDQLLEAGRRTIAGPARAAIYLEAERTIAEDSPIVILYRGTDHVVTQRRVRDFPLGPAPTVRFAQTWKA